MTNYAIQEQNQDLVSLLAAHFRLLYNPTHAMADAIGMLRMFPGLVGLWPGSGIGNGTTLLRVSDLSANGLHLTPNSALISYLNSISGFVPYLLCNGSGYFSRADTAVLDIFGNETILAATLRGVTFGAWFYPEATNSRPMSKGTTTGNDRSYALRYVANAWSSQISDNGTNAFTSATVAGADNSWQLVVGRFRPSTEVKIYVGQNGGMNTGIFTTSIPATLNNSAGGLAIGGQSDGVDLFTGRIALCFLCAAAVPDIFINTFYQMTAPLFGVSV